MMKSVVEITIISCDDLRVGKKRVKKNSFVTIRSGAAKEQRFTTKMSVEGGSDPLWFSEKSSMDLAALMHAGFFALEVYSMISSGSKLAGGVKVPVSDFLGGYVPANNVQFLSYRLRDFSTGKKNGIINFSVKVMSSEPYLASSHALPPTTLGVPVSENNRFSGVVAGVPVGWFGH